MPKKYIHTEIEGQRVKLTNLDKIIYPTIGVVKAEVIQYFVQMSDLLLKYAGHRPLTLIRFPDGVEADRFYKKDKPKWAPDWIESVRLSGADDNNDYVVAKNKASMAWLGNLAALELHPMQNTVDFMDVPDHWIIDLDPDENLTFDRVREVAFQLNEFLQKYGYRPLIKTSGGKGLHLVMPLKRIYSYEILIHSIKSLMKQFIKDINSDCTLFVHKDKRKGKILLDIYRNHRGNTTVAPYSLRGRAGAPVSTPVEWNQVEHLTSAKDYHIKNIFKYIEDHGDVWSKWDEHITELHDQTQSFAVSKNDTTKVSAESNEVLADYNKKRNFTATKEPKGQLSAGPNNRYVVQLHNASNLHYDLRLEIDGVLKSWAIPKGLPIRPGVKRMAIQTEDHPVKYLTYEGIIPKGEYGAGEMWIYASGTYDMVSGKGKKLKFKLKGKKYNRSYKMYKTKDQQWLIECDENKDDNLLDDGILPMIASSSPKLLNPKNKIYEIKWDGIRAIIYLENGRISIKSKNGNDLTDKFPEFADGKYYFDNYSGVFDGEIVCLDEVGKPVFNKVISRMHTQGEQKILAATKSNPAYCYLFDLMFLDGKDTMNEPLDRRQAWLKTILKKQASFRLSQAMDDGQGLAKAAREAGLEGVMVKDKTAKYQPGQKSTSWIKVKFRNDDECTIIGYTKGQGDRVGTFGALHLAKLEGEKWVYFGKVGSGFNGESLKTVLAQLKSCKVKTKYIDVAIEEESRTTWIAPVLKCKIKYASMTNNNTYREPVFMAMLAAMEK